MGKLIVASDQDVDSQFGLATANAARMVFAPAPTPQELKSHLEESPDSVVFWGVDQASGKEALSLKNISQILRKHSKPERVFAISDTPLNTIPTLFNDAFFNHHIRRRYEPPAAQILARLVNATMLGGSVETEVFVPPGTKVSKVSLTSSTQRTVAIEAVSKTVLKLGVPSRLEAIISKSVDELLMNAIFDAPCENGEFFRKKVDRTEKFALEDRSVVDLEMAFSPEYICICVRDRYGSVTKDALLKYIRKNYTANDYKVQTDTPSAGLGIYGMLHEGLSLVYVADPEFQTNAYVFIPLVRNLRAFRKAFHFWSIN